MKVLIGLFIILFTSSLYAITVRFLWQPPTQNTNNTVIKAGELTGFKIYWGIESENYTNIELVAGGDTKVFEVKDVHPSDIYAVITAVNKDGIESLYSNEVYRPLKQVPSAPDVIITVMLMGEY